MGLAEDNKFKKSYYSFSFPINLVAKVANATTETELTGINMAAIIGDRFPEIAKLIPIMLYTNEIVKLSFTMFNEVLVN